MDNSQVEIERHLVRVARGAAVTLAGSMVLQPAGLLFAVLLVRVLGEAGFGVLSLGTSLLLVGGIVVTAGLPQSIIRYVPLCEARGESQRAAGSAARALAIMVASGLAAAAVTSLAARPVSERLFHKPALAEVLSVLAWALPLEALRLGMAAATVARHTTLYEAGANVVRLVVGLLAAVVLAGPAGLGLKGAALGVVIGSGLAAAVATLGAGIVFPELLDRPWRLVKTSVRTGELLAFALPMVLSRIAYIGLYEVNTLLAGYWLTSVEVGIYAAASRLARFGAAGLVAVGSILRPSISRLHSSGKLRELDHVFVIATRWVCMVTMPLLAFIAMRSREVLGLFGPSFPDGAPALVVLCVGQMVNVSTGNVGHMLAMSGRQMLQLIDNFVVMVLNVGLCVLLIPRYGLLGAAAGGAMAMALVNLLRVAQVWSLYRISPYRLATAKVPAAAVLAAPVLLVNFGGDVANLAGGFAAYGLAYAVLLRLLGPAPEDRLLVKALLRRHANTGRTNSESETDNK